MAGGTLSIVGLTSESSTTSTFSWPYLGSDPVVKVVSTGVEVWYYNPKSSSTVLYGSYSYTRPETFLGLSTSSGGSVNYNIGDEVAINTSGNSYSLYVVVEAAQNDPYLTTGFDLTSVANAIRTKGGTSASLVYPAGYISAINALPVGALQSYKSAVFTSPGSATLTPDSGYVGIEEISVEYSPSVYDGAYHTVVCPVKGDIINIDGISDRSFLVLKVNGIVGEVLSRSNYGSSKFSASPYYNTYSGGALDTRLNTTYYDTLPNTVKSAIVDKTFTQDRWYRSSAGSPVYNGQGNYQISLSSASYKSAITRHIYALSVQDIIDYLGVTTSMTTSNTTLTRANLVAMYNATSGAYWLSSAGYGSNANKNVMTVSIGTSTGYLSIANDGGYSYNCRPAFQIDFSKIGWTYAS